MPIFLWVQTEAALLDIYLATTLNAAAPIFFARVHNNTAANMHRMARLSFVCLVCWAPWVGGQFERGTPQFDEVMEQNTESLDLELRVSQELVGIFDPAKSIESKDEFTFSEPKSVEFEVGLIVDPCRQLMEAERDPEGRVLGGWDCCMDVFGTPEFGQNRNYQEEDADRRIEKFPLAELAETVKNINRVRTDMSPMFEINSRRADDETFLAEECNGVKDPFVYCAGLRLGERRFRKYPNCTDNNETVYADQPCFGPDGEVLPFCVQVGYTQTAYSMICNQDSEFAEDPHCGTFLEVHIVDGTVYDEESFVISEAKVRRRDTNGYVTTTLPLNYGGRVDKILCDYEEDYIRVGSLVYIESSAPRCCCPHVYTDALFTGFFFCPGNEFEDFDVDDFKGGPFASLVNDLDEYLLDDEMIDTYPYCPITAPDEDVMYCSSLTKGFETYSASTRHDGRAGRSLSLRDHQRGNRHFVSKCPNMIFINDTKQFGSTMLRGQYPGVCPYFPACGQPVGAFQCNASEGLIELSDFEYSFRGFVGKVTSVPNPTDPDPKFFVTFNNGRTSYPFVREDLRLERQPHNYELWWVQRTLYNFIVMKRKPFKVVSPKCTFDNTNDRYFPWAYVLNHTNPDCRWCDPGTVPCIADFWPLDERDLEPCLIVDPEVSTSNPTITPLP